MSDEMATSAHERFWSKVDKSGECWIWQAGTNEHGYGRFMDAPNVQIPAHRWAFREAYGWLPSGSHLDHICHTPGCVRPEHLRPATPKQNNENRKGANRNSKTGVRGVYWSARDKKWVAAVEHNRKYISCGMFNDPEVARAAVIHKRIELFPYSQDTLNDIPEKYRDPRVVAEIMANTPAKFGPRTLSVWEEIARADGPTSAGSVAAKLGYTTKITTRSFQSLTRCGAIRRVSKGMYVVTRNPPPRKVLPSGKRLAR